MMTTPAAPGSWTAESGPMPALYIGHGAPPLLDDPIWRGELSGWAARLPRPQAILIVSAHWESAPLAISSSTEATPLVYDFGGFDERYYRMSYRTPDAAALAHRIATAMPSTEPVHEHRRRGLDHGAWVPLTVMYPEADIPVLQMSLPTYEPQALLDLGRRLKPLREEGILVIGSGFLTHGLPFLKDWRIDAAAPTWSVEFDAWAREALARGDVDELAAYATKAPGMPYAHPTSEHLAPLFVTLGAAEQTDRAVDASIDGFWMGLSKRSFQVA